MLGKSTNGTNNKAIWKELFDPGSVFCLQHFPESSMSFLRLQKRMHYWMQTLCQDQESLDRVSQPHTLSGLSYPGQLWQLCLDSPLVLRYCCWENSTLIDDSIKNLIGPSRCAIITTEYDLLDLPCGLGDLKIFMAENIAGPRKHRDDKGPAHGNGWRFDSAQIRHRLRGSRCRQSASKIVELGVNGSVSK